MKKSSLILLAVAFITLGCKNNQENQDENMSMEAEEGMETTANTNQEVALFDGKNLDSWKAFNSDTITQWKVEDGALAFTRAEGKRSGSENLITKEEFTNFELSLEWKISEGGNSGIMWGVQEGPEFNEPYLTGPEIQVLDNQKHPDAKNGPVRQAGALYDMVEPSKDVTKPAGEWNSTVIRIDHEANKGTVTTNGTKITEFPLHGEEWNKLVANSKFAEWENFGKQKTGHIALQDHDDKVWYRNIKIKELE
jgi:hypothetical protein